MKMLLFSKTKVLVEVGEKSIVLDSLSSTIIHKEDIIKVFPLAEGLLPFVFVCEKPCQFIKSVVFPDHILYEIVDFPRMFTPKIFLHKQIGGGGACVVGSPQNFLIMLGGKTFSKALEHEITDIEIIDTPRAVVLQGIISTEAFLMAFHKQQKSFISFVGSVEFSGENIKAITNSKTLAGHGMLSEYNITETGFELVSKDAVYLNKRPNPVPPFLIHIAFFEAVREKDYNLAKTYLAPTLLEKLSPEHLEQFFGQFSGIKVLRGTGQTKIALIQQNIAAVFSLSFENGKICDIQKD